MIQLNSKFFFRCDGGQADGMGHIMQSLTLAQAFREVNNFDIEFITYSPDNVGKQKIEDFNFQVIESSGPAGSDSDLQFVLNLFKKQRAKPLFIADNRNINEQYLLQCMSSCILVRITDQKQQNWPCHVLINNTLNISKNNYKPQLNDQLLLLGPKFNLIKDSFFRNKTDAINDKPLHLLLTMGGEDPYNHSSWFIRHLCEILRQIDFTTIIGPAHPQKEQVKNDIAEYVPHGTLVINTNNMAHYMALADIAITAGGNTCYELAAMGVPQIGIELELHQQELIHSMEQSGCLLSLGWHESLTSGDVKTIVLQLMNSPEKRVEMQKKAKMLFSKPGAPLIVSEILNTFK